MSVLLRRSINRFNISSIRSLLTSSFAIEESWEERHKEINKLGLGGDYEWIATVQKKFIGGGYASAVDVDAAVCMGEHKDQVSDLIDILRKLRHSPYAYKMSPSSQYALLRLLLKYNPQEIVVLANDTINNGIFPDEHAACLIMDHFIKKDQIANACGIGCWLMQQEMLSSELVNSLSLYSCLKWIELPFDERSIKEENEEDDDMNDDDIVTLKMAYLKNHYNDEHFDLIHLQSLVAKTLSWLAREMNIDPLLKSGCIGMSNILNGRLIDGLDRVVLKNIHSYLSSIPNPTQEQTDFITKLSTEIEGVDVNLSSLALSYFKGIQEKEEKDLVDIEKNKFMNWNERRKSLIEAQANKLNLKIKRVEMEEEMSSLTSEEENLFFFQNRLLLEKSARDNAEVRAEAAQMNK